jgi:hypothetical protein
MNALCEKTSRMPDTGFIMTLPPTAGHGESIAQIANCRHYIHDSTPLGRIADALSTRTDLYALGVIDENGHATGIVLARDIFNQLGRPFGRELFSARTILDLQQRSRAFHYRKNILSVAQSSDGNCISEPTAIICLLMSENRFQVFSLPRTCSSIFRKSPPGD